MKHITVTAENIAAFSPYQGTTHKLQIGEVLQVTTEKVPNVRTVGYFAIVTNWIPTENTLYLIARKNDAEAKMYGWDIGAEIIEQSVANKDADCYFNRYSINQKLISNK